MSTSIQVRVDYEGASQERTFTSLPISFGRGEECDLVLPYTFVSRRHGRIEGAGGCLVVVDEESLNGISCGDVRVAPTTPFELGADGGEVLIEALRISVRTCEVTDPLGASDSPENTDPLPTPGSDPETRTSLYAEQGIQPTVLDRGLRAIDEYRAARAAALEELREAMDSIDESGRASLAREIAAALGDLGHDPALQLLARGPGLVGGGEIEHEIRALAEHHAPHVRPLGGSTDAADFVGRFDAVLTLALDALAELEISAGAGIGPSPGISAAGASLRAEVLDWTSPLDVRARIASVAASIRQRYEGRVAETRSAAFEVLNALSPERTERELRLPWWLLPFRVNALWAAQRARYPQVLEAYARTQWRAHCARLARLSSSVSYGTEAACG